MGDPRGPSGVATGTDPLATADSLTPGTVIASRYRVERQVFARGPLSLWRGDDLVLARPVAVHVLTGDVDPAYAHRVHPRRRRRRTGRSRRRPPRPSTPTTSVTSPTSSASGSRASASRSCSTTVPCRPAGCAGCCCPSPPCSPRRTPTACSTAGTGRESSTSGPNSRSQPSHFGPHRRPDCTSARVHLNRQPLPGQPVGMIDEEHQDLAVPRLSRCSPGRHTASCNPADRALTTHRPRPGRHNPARDERLPASRPSSASAIRAAARTIPIVCGEATARSR